MAGKNQVNKEVEKRIVNVKAKVNIKYDKDIIKAGEEFLVRLSDVEVIKEHGEILSNIEELKKAASEEKDKNENGDEK